MKKYRIEHRRPYADDPESVFEEAVEDPDGNWIPAETAQALYEALGELLEASLSTKMMSSDGVVEDARAALKAAEEG